jgi:hypothetical protein
VIIPVILVILIVCTNQNILIVKKQVFFIFLVLLFIASNSISQSLISGSDSLVNPQISPQADVNDFFKSDEILTLTLITDFKNIFTEVKKQSDTIYHNGIILYTLNDDIIDTVKVKVKPRGTYRKDPKHCAFPPLFVKFSDKQAKDTPFKGLDRLKLVTHCSNTQQVYNQYVLREFLVYKIYNLLTDSSFRVRLLNITYKDAGSDMEPITRHGFFIEDEDLMAARIGGKIIEIKNIHQDRTNYNLINLLALFEFMIGNPDWDVSLQHNIKIVQTNPFELPLAVPYDFDYCGIVNTKYAAPAEELNISSVTERVFRGFCRTQEEFEMTFDKFRSSKEQIYNLYRNLQDLDEDSKNWSFKYLDQFFEIMDSPIKVKKEILDTCWPNRK